ncbi:MAG: lipopolysaccharide biosynthesis protein RfbH [Methanomassiliicoccales archaeon]|nr:lipopolysaccharide biosynthesis protein RfbH [Methanomassiliicoccales archaeon]
MTTRKKDTNLANPGLDQTDEAVELRGSILDSVARYYQAVHQNKPFRPGVDYVPVAGRVFDQSDLQALVASSLDFWLTSGRFNELFEAEFSKFLGTRHVVTTNSGSSANLLAISALTSPQLDEKRLKPGDEIITVAAGFPTTIAPIIQNSLVPVFVDVSLPTYNANVEALEKAVTNRSKAIFLAHTLGNPFDVDEVRRIAKENDLWLIEDCCDALGSEYRGVKAGTFGQIATFSFYPAHHITMGEGGAVATNDKDLAHIVRSFRDWGRDCYCDPGKDDTCGKRFAMQHGDLPFGYDHKYVYSHIGYNLKITDMQAAVGLAQLQHLPYFIKARRERFETIKKRIQPLEEFLILPEATKGSNPCWFGFPMTMRDGRKHARLDLLRYLEQHRIGARLLFGGNLVCQPCMAGQKFRVSGSSENTDRIMNDTFWTGVYPGLSPEMIDYFIETMTRFFSAPLR